MSPLSVLGRNFALALYHHTMGLISSACICLVPSTSWHLSARHESPTVDGLCSALVPALPWYAFDRQQGPPADRVRRGWPSSAVHYAQLALRWCPRARHIRLSCQHGPITQWLPLCGHEIFQCPVHPFGVRIPNSLARIGLCSHGLHACSPRLCSPKTRDRAASAFGTFIALIHSV